MISKIEDLTNLLREVRSSFQAQIIDAEETKKKELAALSNGYIKGAKPYKEKEQQIVLDYSTAIVQARKAAAEKAGKAIEDLRDWELLSVQRIDENVLAKINAVKDIPLTTKELQIILEKHGTSNYWVQRSIAAIADKNGIPQVELHLNSSIDTKLSVLDGLSEQLEKMLENFTMDLSKSKHSKEAMKARWLYLNDDILKNSISIYNNGLQDISDMDAATKAYYQIKATSGQMQKGILISNAMRNLKREDAKNILLHRLSTDSDITDSAFEVAGIADTIGEWKSGKNDRYIKAEKIMEELKKETDSEKIKENLRIYMADVDNGIQKENEFLSKALVKTHKKNSCIGKALGEMSDLERRTLLGNTEYHKTDKAAEGEES